ncbi:pentapeptide repeat-containing protein [Hoeflea sp. CAU 1731]
MTNRFTWSWKLLVASAVLCSVGLAALDARASCSSNPAPGVDWSDCRKRNLILSDTDLSGANMSGSELISTDLRHAKLDGANLERADLLRTVFHGSSLVGANFMKAAGYRADFSNADLTDASFEKSEMQRTGFTAATLVNVNFSKASLGRARFNDATIEDVNFDFSILARADFRGAAMSGSINFSNAFVYLARFEGVDLTNAEGLVQSQIDMSCGDTETVLPDGLDPSSAWPCSDEDQ